MTAKMEYGSTHRTACIGCAPDGSGCNVERSSGKQPQSQSRHAGAMAHDSSSICEGDDSPLGSAPFATSCIGFQFTATIPRQSSASQEAWSVESSQTLPRGDVTGGAARFFSGASSSWEPRGARRESGWSIAAEGQHEHHLEEQEEMEQDEESIPTAQSDRFPATVNGFPTTTIILRNLPPGLQQDDLLQWLPQPDEAKYNMVHVPISVSRKLKARSGYAFMNFDAHENAVAFYHRWHGRPLRYPSTSGRTRAVRVAAAVRQGFVANLLQLQLSLHDVHRAAVLPAIFIAGQRQDFWSFVRAMRPLSSTHAHAEKGDSDGENGDGDMQVSNGELTIGESAVAAQMQSVVGPRAFGGHGVVLMQSPSNGRRLENSGRRLEDSGLGELLPPRGDQASEVDEVVHTLSL